MRGSDVFAGQMDDNILAFQISDINHPLIGIPEGNLVCLVNLKRFARKESESIAICTVSTG